MLCRLLALFGRGLPTLSKFRYIRVRARVRVRVRVSVVASLT